MFYTRFNRPTSVGLSQFASSLCQKHLKRDCDVNVMIAKFLGGDASCLRHGVYLDCTSVPSDFTEMQNIITRANSVWHDLPDNVRYAYRSPENLIKALDDEQSRHVSQTHKVVSESVEKPKVDKDNKNLATISSPTVTAQPAAVSTDETAHAS